MRKNYSRQDYFNESEKERRDTWWEFCGYLEENFSGQPFGYDSFPDLNWEEMTFSTIFATLKDAGYIRSDGYMKFRLTGMKREEVFR